MGGDVAVALAGIDHRIGRVAAIAATPDWTRPGMRDISDPSQVLPQGRPNAYHQWFYQPSDPLSHLSHYAHAPAIAFECGADDSTSRRTGRSGSVTPWRRLPACRRGRSA